MVFQSVGDVVDRLEDANDRFCLMYPFDLRERKVSAILNHGIVCLLQARVSDEHRSTLFLVEPSDHVDAVSLTDKEIYEEDVGHITFFECSDDGVD